MNKSGLFVELGVEEIPAWMLADAARQFACALQDALRTNRLAFAPGPVWYTPRRIIVGIGEIPARQDDLKETVVGPPRSAAFDAEGKPTRAAEAFALKNGVAVHDLEIAQTPKGQYVSAVRLTKGAKTRDILNRIIPEAIASIQFAKTMHWTPDKFRFARPLRWIVAVFGARALHFSVADVKASRYTAGHRFLGRRHIGVDSLEDLRSKLAANGVVADPVERKRLIEEGLLREAQAAGGNLLPDADLLNLVVNLNEYPSVIRGSFEERFLELPQEILVTVMREHQKYFSVFDASGNLLPTFLAVINLAAASTSKIREGHERVLRARLADACFFWETDRKILLAARRESLRAVLYQEKLGSYADKTNRVLQMIPALAERAGCASESQHLTEAASLMKCDLVTEMVKEFTDLQGVVGGLYARAEGYPESVWRAVYEQYLPKSTASASPSTAGAAVLALADRLDTVCGCFSVGLVPSGSKDPFAVRRAGNGILKIILDHGFRCSMKELVARGLASFNAAVGVREELLRFFESRLRFLFEEAGYPYDCVNAALVAGWDDVVDARERVKALEQLHGEEDFLAVASSFKRIMNILGQAERIDQEPVRSVMSDRAEIAMYEVYASLRPQFEQARQEHRYPDALRLLGSMRQVVDSFFDEVLVMAPENHVRANRLALLSALSRLFLRVADISQIVLGKNGFAPQSPASR